MSIHLSTEVSPEQLAASRGGEVKASIGVAADLMGKHEAVNRHVVLCIDASYSMAKKEDESVGGQGNRRIDHAIAGYSALVADDRALHCLYEFGGKQGNQFHNLGVRYRRYPIAATRGEE